MKYKETHHYRHMRSNIYIWNFPAHENGQIYSWVLIYGTCASYRNGSARNPEMTFWNSNFRYVPDNKTRPRAGKLWHRNGAFPGFRRRIYMLPALVSYRRHITITTSKHRTRTCVIREKSVTKFGKMDVAKAYHFCSAHQVGLSTSICPVVFVAFAFLCQWTVLNASFSRTAKKIQNIAGIEERMAINDDVYVNGNIRKGN